jgi:hypothetical protein
VPGEPQAQWSDRSTVTSHRGAVFWSNPFVLEGVCPDDEKVKARRFTPGGFLPRIVLTFDFDHASRAKGGGQTRRVSSTTHRAPCRS